MGQFELQDRGQKDRMHTGKRERERGERGEGRGEGGGGGEWKMPLIPKGFNMQN